MPSLWRGVARARCSAQVAANADRSQQLCQSLMAPIARELTDHFQAEQVALLTQALSSCWSGRTQYINQMGGGIRHTMIHSRFFTAVRAKFGPPSPSLSLPHAIPACVDMGTTLLPAWCGGVQLPTIDALATELEGLLARYGGAARGPHRHSTAATFLRTQAIDTARSDAGGRDAADEGEGEDMSPPPPAANGVLYHYLSPHALFQADRHCPA